MSEKKRKYAGADWIRRALKVEAMSILGENVANLLGDVFFGIYHLDDKDLKRVDWTNPHVIALRLTGRDLATVDGSRLTQLVVYSHDRMLRCSISPYSRQAVELMFHGRSSRLPGDPVWQRCPTIEDHISAIRGWAVEVDDERG